MRAVLSLFLAAAESGVFEGFYQLDIERKLFSFKKDVWLKEEKCQKRVQPTKRRRLTPLIVE
jgi:hypothetical protein